MGNLKNKRWLERRKDIPNFTYYGFVGNIWYAIKKLYKFNTILLCALVFCGFLSVLVYVVNLYLPKVMVDYVERNEMFSQFLYIIVLLCLINIISNFFTNKIQYSFEWQYKKVLLFLNEERLKKSITTDLSNMETPLFLDILKRAERATKRGFGFYGVFKNIASMISQLLLVAISAVSIVMVNPFIVIVLAILSFSAYKVLEITMEEDKVKHNDVLAPIQRRIQYLDKIARDNDYAKDICLYSMEKWLETVLFSYSREFIETFRKHHNRWIKSDAIMNTIIAFQSVIAYGWLLYRVFFVNMSIGDFVLYLGLVNTFSKSLTDFLWTVGTVNKNSMDINDYRSFLEWPDHDENDDVKTIGLIDNDRFEFRFEHVYFKYPGHENYVIKDLNLVIKSGEKLAVVGVNGAGKSTFINLLLRLYEPTSGTILLNGKDIKKYNIKEYRSIFAPIFQNVEYFAIPVWNNISLETEKNSNMDFVQECAEKSGLGSKIASLKKGIRTPMHKIFERDGVEFSGGENQRLAMARALYKKSQVVVLDEPTAALDALAEDKLYREFNEIIKQKTAVFISHRLSSTKFCDEIVLFENGTIAEQGTHDELISNNGKYAEMYEVQAKYYREEEIAHAE